MKYNLQNQFSHTLVASDSHASPQQWQATSRVKSQRLGRSVFMKTALPFLLVFAAVAPMFAATTLDWNPPVVGSGGSVTWATGGNWVGGTAPTNDLTTHIARFNQTSYNFQPNAGTTSINGLQFGDGSTITATLTLAGTALSIGNGGITKFANAGATTISSPIKLGSDQNWANNSSSVLTVSGTVSNVANVSPFTLTLNGSGIGGTTISGVISNGGATGTTALTINNTGGATTLSANNTYTGATTITAGTLQIGSGSTTGKLATTGTISNDGVLIFNRSNSVTQGTDFSSSAINGSGQVIQNGTSLLTLNVANGYSGGTTVNSGNLQFSSGAVPSSGLITINSGGALNSTGAFTTVATWLSSGKIATGSSGSIALTGNSANAIDFTGYSNLMLGASSAATYSGALTAAGTTYRLGGGGSTLTVSSGLNASGNSLVVGADGSTGTVVLTAANAYTGATTLNSGTLSLSGPTGTVASSAVTANAGSALSFDSTASGATRAASVTLKDAALTVTGNATSNSVDTITGALTLDKPSTWGNVGANTVTVTAGAMNAQLVAGSLVRANNGAVFFRGTNLGQNTIASNTAGASNISFSTAPSAQLVGGGGAAGTTTISILPWAVGSTTAGGVPTGFVTYDANGIRVLSSGAGEYATTITGGASTTDNVMLSAAGGTVTANGATTINSLFLNNAAATTTVLAGTGALTVTSGAIYADFSLGGNNDVLVISKQIDFGAVEGVIGTMGTLNSKTLSFSGGISGSGGITIYTANATATNQGGVNLGAANTYTGDTIINGQAIAANVNALANFANNGRTGDVYVNGTLGLSGSNNSSVRMNGLWGNGRIITPFSNNETLIVGDNNATSTFTGTITQTNGGIGLTKIGAGTLTLSGTNTYTSGTTVSGGTLKGTQTSSTPFGTGSVAITNSTLALAPTGSGADINLTGSVAGSGNAFTYNTGATFSLDKGSNTSLTYTQGSSISALSRGTNGTLILSVGAIANLGNTVAGGGERFIMPGTVTQVNTLVSGVVGQDRGNSNAGDFVTYDATNGFKKATYTSSNTFANVDTDVVSITSGTSTGGATAAYAIKVTGTTLTNTGNTITLGSSTNPIAGLVLNSGTISGGTLLTPASSATEFGIYTSGASAISSSINTATSQAGVTVFGPGSLDVSGSTGNSFTGSLRVNQSTLIYNDNNQLGSSTSSITLNGGTLQSSGTVALGGGSRAIILAAGGANTGGTFDVTSGTTTYQNASASSKLMSGSGASLTKTGSGTLALTGNTTNTYTGGTFVNVGTLQLGASDKLANTGDVTVGGGTFAIQTFSDTVGAVTLTSGSITGTTGVLTGSSYDVRSGSASAILGGSGVALTKTTTGTVTLSGTNTYTGNTSVSAGKLLVNGSTDSASAVSVSAGTATGTPVATLGGTGIVGGNVSLTAESTATFKNGGILAPTASASGTALAVTGTTTFNTGSIFEFDLNAATTNTRVGETYGQLAGTGIIGGSGAIFNIVLGTNAFTDVFWDTTKTWTNVFTQNNVTTNTLASIFSGGFGGPGVDSAGLVSGQGSFTLSGTDTLTWSAVPEPTSALAGILIGVGLLRRRRA
ncbi:MAG: autotransporter-associated beta strand repeat-containing protein [Luteolibacter sp.]